MEESYEASKSTVDHQVVRAQTAPEELPAQDLLTQTPQESIELLRQFFYAGLFGV